MPCRRAHTNRPGINGVICCASTGAIRFGVTPGWPATDARDTSAHAFSREGALLGRDALSRAQFKGGAAIEDQASAMLFTCRPSKARGNSTKAPHHRRARTAAMMSSTRSFTLLSDTRFQASNASRCCLKLA